MLLLQCLHHKLTKEFNWTNYQHFGQGFPNSDQHYHVLVLLFAFGVNEFQLVRAEERDWRFKGHGFYQVSHSYAFLLRGNHFGVRFLSPGHSYWNHSCLYDGLAAEFVHWHRFRVLLPHWICNFDHRAEHFVRFPQYLGTGKEYHKQNSGKHFQNDMNRKRILPYL